MVYHITSYKPEYLEDHYKIGAEIYNEWPMGGQTKIEQLQKTYQGEDFDPETRLYAFLDKKMVGFITCSLIKKEKPEDPQHAYFEWPYVLKDQQKKVEPLLIERAFEVLKAKDVRKVITRAGDYWGHTREQVETYSFTYQSDIVRAGVYNVSNLNQKESDETVNYQSSEHENLIRKWMESQYQMPEQQITSQVDALKRIELGKWLLNPWDIRYHWVSNAIYVNNKEIVGRLAAIHNPNFGMRSCNLMNLWVKNSDEKVENILLNKLSNDMRKYNLDRILIHTGIWGFPDSVQERWEKKGVQFRRKLAYYFKHV